MAETVLRGAGASPGRAAGAARLLDPAPDAAPASGDVETELGRAKHALEAAAGDLEQLSARAAAEGRKEGADILDANALMARDPGLIGAVEGEVRNGRSAEGALLAAADAQAAILDGLGDEMLAARADDVRSIGRRAARFASGEASEETDGRPSVLVARDLGPADVAELRADVRAIALAAGAVTAHAAIVARARGLPLVVGAGDELLAAKAGEPVVVDGDAGEVVLHPESDRLAAAEAAAAEAERDRVRVAAAAGLPAVTTDGQAIRVLVNVAGAAEVEVGLAAGAEGSGLIRTELAFLDARAWPTEEEHVRALEPILAALSGRVATVRVLDFGGDKTPTFLHGTPDRGIALLLGEPEAFAAQARAILATAGDSELRVMLPMVRSAAELDEARGLVGEASVGAMIETADAVADVRAIAAAADFLSIGTNDLTHDILGSDRFTGRAAQTEDPRVLTAIAQVVEAGHAEGLIVEVCGEAASDPAVLPLLVGLGVDELSVGAARVGLTRAHVRELSFAEAQARATRAAR